MALHVEPGPRDFRTGTVTGPASYATGGFVVDLSSTLSTVEFLRLVVETLGPNLPPHHLEYAFDTPAPGQVTVKVMRHRYDRVSSVGNVTGQPGGVTVQGASGASVASESAHTHGAGTLGTASESAHTHSVDLPNFVGNTASESAHTHSVTHDHPSTTSSAAQSPSIAPTAGVGGNAADDATHTHTFDPPSDTTPTAAGSAHNHGMSHNHGAQASAAGSAHSHTVTGSTGAGSAHAHVDNNIYEHGHSNTQAQTNASSVELPAGTDLSGTTFRYLAVGT